MKESNFQTAFNRWSKYNWHFNFACELKLSKEKSIPFTAVEKHQVEKLLIAKHGSSGFNYKIPDDTQQQKPFDFFKLYLVPAYITIMFYRRGQKTFYMIDIDNFVNEMTNSERKSLTEERAAQIGNTCTLS